MKKYLYYAACGLALSLAMGACGNDEPEIDIPDEPQGEMEQLSPSESKKYLETTGSEFLSKFKAADQRDLMEVAAWVSEEYGDLDMPKEFEVEPVITDRRVSDFLRGVAYAMSHADATKAGEALVTYTYSLDFDQFKGVYEPGRYRWNRTGDSNDIVFQFKDKYGKECKLVAKAAKGTSDVDINVNDYEWDWDEENGYYEYDVVYAYKTRIPKQVTVTLTNGGATLVNGTINSDINVKGHKVSVDGNVTVANISAIFKVEGSDTKVTETSNFVVSGSTLVSTTATVDGNKLCDLDNWQSMADSDDGINDDAILTVLKNGTATVSVLNRVRVDGNVQFNRDIIGVDTYWDQYDYSKDDAEKLAKKAAENFNKYVTAEVRYGNAATVQANLLWKPKYDDNYYYWEYTLEPLLKFASDGTTYGFEEYFENGFSNLVDQWEDLIKSYEKVWDAITE